MKNSQAWKNPWDLKLRNFSKDEVEGLVSCTNSIPEKQDLEEKHIKENESGNNKYFLYFDHFQVAC